MPPRISADGLTVSRGRRTVLRDISFSLPTGVTALVGRNGAGKSTLMLTLVGLLAPAAGTVRMESGPAAGTRAFNRQLGWMPQHLSFPRFAKVADTVDYAAWLRGIGQGRPGTVEEALELADLTSLQRRRTATLSGGEVRRLGLACAVVGSPGFIVLDEPTVGLDPLQREDILARVRRLAEHHTVLMSTHIVEDITDSARHLLALNGGRVVFDGRVDDLADPGAARADLHRAVKDLISGEGRVR